MDGLNAAAQKSVSTATPFLTSYPAGVCCHELAMMIHSAERKAPNATSQVDT